MLFNYFDLTIQNSYMLDSMFVKTSYIVPRLRKIVMSIRSKKELDFTEFFDQYVFLIFLFNQGFFYLLKYIKKTYKEGIREIEIYYKGVKGVVLTNFKDKRNVYFKKFKLKGRNLLFTNKKVYYLLFLIRKYFFIYAKIDQVINIRLLKYLDENYYAMTFSLIFSIKNEHRKYIFSKIISRPNIKCFFSLNFNSYNFSQNILYLSFFKLPLYFFKKKKIFIRLKKKKRKNRKFK